MGSGIGYQSPCISIHALREEGDQGMGSIWKEPFHFYPRPPRGGRLWALGKPLLVPKFLSTPSARRATLLSAVFTHGNLEFLSTPSARRATVYISRSRLACYISIHALREEGDKLDGLITGEDLNISIHALREEGDPDISIVGGSLMIFLSTPSARRATPTALNTN